MRVAPFTGAWIEIDLIAHHGNLASPSHPSRVRGLKYVMQVYVQVPVLLSHPSRVRGLKFVSEAVDGLSAYVAPFTGAWIEINFAAQDFFPAAASHPSRVRGLKSLDVTGTTDTNVVAPFTGAWIEILKERLPVGITLVAPFTGAWIEISAYTGYGSDVSGSHPSRVRGLKLAGLLMLLKLRLSRTLHGCVD